MRRTAAGVQGRRRGGIGAGTARWLGVAAGLAVALLVSAGCAPRTRVILLPEEGGREPGGVVVRTDRATRVLDRPYTATTVADRSASPAPSEPVTAEAVQRDYGALIEAAPPRPVSFLLHFITDSTRLTEASEALIPTILAEAERRAPAEISIIGHTDTAGTAAYNADLARQRAEAVAGILREAGADMAKVFISSHGENDPLVPTGDEVPEPRNRRVEIMIR